jgi:hypothetical protein
MISGGKMNFLNKWIVIITAIAMTGLSNQQLEAVTYVTDTGGYAYDESRTATNLAPAIALGTVAIVGIIAIAVQNSHHSSSSHSSSSSHTNTGYYSHSQ